MKGLPNLPPVTLKARPSPPPYLVLGLVLAILITAAHLTATKIKDIDVPKPQWQSQQCHLSGVRLKMNMS